MKHDRIAKMDSEIQPTCAQPVPSVTSDDVERIVRRDFEEEQFAAVMAILRGYETNRRGAAPDRVHLAALKLANGSVETLRCSIESAKRDFRDVLAYAEYPQYMERVVPGRDLSADERLRIIDSDWKQYEKWLLE